MSYEHHTQLLDMLPCKNRAYMWLAASKPFTLAMVSFIILIEGKCNVSVSFPFTRFFSRETPRTSFGLLTISLSYITCSITDWLSATNTSYTYLILNLSPDKVIQVDIFLTVELILMEINVRCKIQKETNCD